MAALLGLWRVIQDYFVTPRIMGSHLKLHPLATIVALLVGAKIGGIIGIYLAIPFMASLRVICCARTEQQSGHLPGHPSEPRLSPAPCVSETATA
jgi:predicted PurR-regulated permease PerM